MDRINKDKMFTKAEMLDELRTIFLFEADHIILGAGSKMAEQFIGFPTESGEYCHMSSTLVDLRRFDISDSFDRGYDFAFRPSLTNTIEEHEVQNLIAFMEGTPRIGGVSSAGEVHDFMEPDGMCQTVADAVHARWKLEWDSVGRGSHTFTTRELALLANMTEGAVRNAMADKGENGLRAIPGSKPVRVEYDEARRWLAGRRGFVPTPQQPQLDTVLHEDLASVKTVEEFTLFMRKYINLYADLVLGHVVDSVLPDPDYEAWVDRGTFAFDVDKARRIAEGVGLDVPTFVGKALEVSLRRDASAEGGRS